MTELHYSKEYMGNVPTDKEIIDYLEQENKRLKIDFNDMKNINNFYQETFEKMKNRCNCKHGRYSTIGIAFFACSKGIEKCNGCKEWELSDE